MKENMIFSGVDVAHLIIYWLDPWGANEQMPLTKVKCGTVQPGVFRIEVNEGVNPSHKVRMAFK